MRVLVGNRLRLPWVQMVANSEISPDLREFRPDRFDVAAGDLAGAGVLLLDDTWTTGARVQSAAYALKRAGVSRVVVVVLGRHVNPGYAGWKPIIDAIKTQPYRHEVCAVHD